MHNKYGLIVGRFQPLHLGHCEIIDQALEMCNRVVIFIGSSQESRTFRNPFTYEERESLIKKCYHDYYCGGRIRIYPLPDIGVGNNPTWGDYIINRFKVLFNQEPNVYFTGNEPIRDNWFANYPKMTQVHIGKRIEVSATQVRHNMLMHYNYYTNEFVGDKQNLMRALPINQIDVDMLSSLCRTYWEVVKPKWVYRLESLDKDNGLWYNEDSKLVWGIGVLKDCTTKDLPMDYDARYHKDGRNWYSSCSNIEDLTHWYSIEDARNLVDNHNFVFRKYLATEYVEYPMETTFIKNTCLSFKTLTVDEVFNIKEDK